MRAWDVIFGLGVLLPLATGGFWGQVGGAKVEYTQPGAAALALALWAWALQRRGSDPWRESFWLAHGLSIWHWWRDRLATSLTPLLLAWLAVSALWFSAAWARHQSFQTHAADLGIFTNAIWNLAESGQPYSSIKGGLSLLADHQNFLIYPIAWLYGLWPSAALLLGLQAAGLASAGVAVYLLLRQRLGPGHSFTALLPLAYWASAPIRAANLFDFHPEVLMLPLFLFAAWGLQAGTWRCRGLGFSLFLLALLAKESAGPVACGLGLAWLCGAGPAETRKFTRSFGAVAIALGLAIFLFDTKWLPQQLGGQYAYSNAYAPLGGSLTDLALAPFQHPQEFFSRIFGISRLRFLLRLLLPFCFLPLLGGPGLIAAAPGYLMLALGAGDQRLSGFHYAIEPMVGLLFALPAGAAAGIALRRQQALLLLLPLAALAQYGRSEPFHWRFYSLSDAQIRARDHFLPRILPDRSVAAQSALVPHLANRRWVHYLPNVANERSENADCVIWEASVNQTPLTAEGAAVLEGFLEKTYALEFSEGPLRVFRRRGGQPCLAP